MLPGIYHQIKAIKELFIFLKKLCLQLHDPIQTL